MKFRNKSIDQSYIFADMVERTIDDCLSIDY